MADDSLASRGRLNEPWGFAASADAVYLAENVPGGDRAVIRRVDLEDGRITTLETPVRPDSEIVGMLGSTLVLNEGLSEPIRINTTTGERLALIPGVNAPSDEFQAVSTDGVSVVLLRRQHSIWRLDDASRPPRHIAGRNSDVPPGQRVEGDDGPAVEAFLGFVEDAVVDREGHVYVSQSGMRADGFRIRRIDAVTGIITTVVGPGTTVQGDDDEALRIHPGPMAVMPDGSLVFADRDTRVLRYDPKTSGVTVVAGGRRGGDRNDGLARQARFDRIWDLAAAPGGALIIFDYGANRLRHVDTTGHVRTLAGNDDRLYGHSRWSSEWATDPPPDNEQCSNRLDAPVVLVAASEDAGEPVDGVLVRLYRTGEFEAPVAHEPRPVAAGTTADGGRVSLEVPTGDRYTVLAAFPGFTPASRTVSVSAGCRGEVPLRLSPVTTTAR